jgi:hypothetical protein
MNPDELKAAVEAAKQDLNTAIDVARAGGVTVNLWVNGGGPANPGASHVELDFGNE